MLRHYDYDVIIEVDMLCRMTADIFYTPFYLYLQIFISFRVTNMSNAIFDNNSFLFYYSYRKLKIIYTCVESQVTLSVQPSFRLKDFSLKVQLVVLRKKMFLFCCYFEYVIKYVAGYYDQ